MAVTVTVVIADDQTVVREGLRSMLTLFDQIVVTGVAADAEEALQLIDATDPDVWLTDLRMPGIGGVEGIRRLVATGSRTRAVALTTYDDDETIVDALSAGAVGFLNKDTDPDSILAGLEAAAQGRSLLDGRAVRALLGRSVAAAPARADASGLTEREVDVVRLIARGLSNQQVARELVVGMATVKTHVNHILAKTGCRDRAALVSYAFARGLAG